MNHETVSPLPTSTSILLLQIYSLENKGIKGLNASKLVNWWVKKADDPVDADKWLNGRLWRMYARHIHAWVMINEPDASDIVAYALAIENSLIPQPKLVHLNDGSIIEKWDLSAYHQSIPPHGFEAWQKPLSMRNRLPVPMSPDFPSRYEVETTRRLWGTHWSSR